MKEKNGDSKYRLRSHITHQGESSSEGHYTACVLKNITWHYTSDSYTCVSQNVTQDRKEAVIYIYERIN